MYARSIAYPLRHPIPMNLSGLGQSSPLDILTQPVQAAVEASVKTGIERSWPMIEAKADALIAKYEQKYMIAAVLVGGLAVVAIALSIKKGLKG